MANAEALIEKARAAMDRDDLVAALELLPAAWRACRHPRIADLIDRVSADEDQVRGPIPGRTVAERCEAWHEIEARHDPGDLGRLLAMLWPGNGKLGLPIHRKMFAWPDDPRVPRVWLQLPRQGYADRVELWKSICERVVACGDTRVVPAMSKLALPRSVRNLIVPMRDRAPPALSPALAHALASIEARYATAIRRERSEPEMLAAIYATPGDLALRQVYADWLSDHGDPRGELISLQCARSAGRSTPKSEQRERALLDTHGKRWAEAFDKILDRPIFEDGFVAGGRLRTLAGWRPGAKRIDPKTQLPPWALIRRLDLAFCEVDVTRLLDSLPHVVGLYHLDADALDTVVRGPARQLQELGWFETDHVTLEPCPAFRTLRALTVATESPMVEHLSRSKLAAQLERITLVGFAPDPKLVKQLLALPKLVELTMHGYNAVVNPYYDPLLAPHGFELRISRDRGVRGGFFRSVRHDFTDKKLAAIIASYVSALPADITSLAISPSRAFKFADRTQIDAMVARFEKARLELPWLP